mmetsp:Transcript_1828/g.2723  ORF Transcript_1828/g.2723 Transcript_1828/m.2723 type:complete len:231 (+) Transcript_1828:239-931(+)
MSWAAESFEFFSATDADPFAVTGLALSRKPLLILLMGTDFEPFFCSHPFPSEKGGTNASPLLLGCTSSCLLFARLRRTLLFFLLEATARPDFLAFASALSQAATMSIPSTWSSFDLLEPSLSSGLNFFFTLAALALTVVAGVPAPASPTSPPGPPITVTSLGEVAGADMGEESTPACSCRDDAIDRYPDAAATVVNCGCFRSCCSFSFETCRSSLCVFLRSSMSIWRQVR